MPKKSYICKFIFARRVNKYIATKHNKLENYLDISRLPKIVATLSRSVPWLYFITKVGNTKYSDGLDTRNMGFWLWKWCQEMVEQGFSSFFAKFFAYLMIFQSFAVPSEVLRIFEKSLITYAKNLAKNEDQLALDQFFG